MEDAQGVGILQSVSLSHQETELSKLGGFLIQDESKKEVLEDIKKKFALTELFYLCTCNRVELVFVSQEMFDIQLASKLLAELWAGDQNAFQIQSNEIIIRSGNAVVERLMRIASSLESMLIGEQEILTQLRKASDFCRDEKISGDLIRISMKKVIETGKRCFSQTKISANPVSIAFLAWERLQKRNVSTGSRIILVGAGQMITSFAKFLVKGGYTNVVVANRSVESAETIARQFNGTALALSDLKSYDKGFDVLVSCTASPEHVVNLETYRSLVGTDDSHKILVDLALPFDIDQSILDEHNVDYLNMHSIQEIVDRNIGLRKLEVGACEEIIAIAMEDYKVLVEQRKVELAMRAIPQTIRDIKTTALEEVFSKEIDELDDKAKETLVNVLAYMEKKYISVPMKMAREVITNAVTTN